MVSLLGEVPVGFQGFRQTSGKCLAPTDDEVAFVQ